MSTTMNRRAALLGIGAAGAGLLSARAFSATPQIGQDQSGIERVGASNLLALTERLQRQPRRRDFKTVPMILDNPDWWDATALTEVIQYRGQHKQVWDNTDIGSPWMNLMRNSLNAQVFSFRHPDFLEVSATHGTAHLALFDQAMWDKYQLSKIAGAGFTSNTLIIAKDKPADAKGYQDPNSLYGPAGNTIPALQRRGAIFMACHNAIWEQAGKLLEQGINPDSLSHGAMAAELTNHLIDGVILTPGIVATLTELQQVGYSYAK